MTRNVLVPVALVSIVLAGCGDVDDANIDVVEGELSGVNQGWYSEPPMRLDICGDWTVMAHGSDKGAMRARACYTSLGTDAAQGVVVFENLSKTSRAVAISNVNVVFWDKNGWPMSDAVGYTCLGKYLEPQRHLYCASYRTAVSAGTAGWAQTIAWPTVNGYGSNYSTDSPLIVFP